MWMTSDEINEMVLWGAIFVVSSLCGATIIAAICCLCGYGFRGCFINNNFNRNIDNVIEMGLSNVDISNTNSLNNRLTSN